MVSAIKRLCVFCGSNSGASPAYEAAARAMGQALARRGITLVYGGGNIGLMGAIGDAVMAAGGEAIGIIPEALMRKEHGHRGITELRVVKSMHERKAMMADLVDGFIAMPGGYGTLEEYCEVLTWTQLGFHRKPCGLLNVAGFYDPLLAFFDRATEQQFVRMEHRPLVLAETDPDTLIERMSAWEPPPVQKWFAKKAEDPR
jgi:uncharacterized protein (TIGR00730 family)